MPLSLKYLRACAGRRGTSARDREKSDARRGRAQSVERRASKESSSVRRCSERWRGTGSRRRVGRVGRNSGGHSSPDGSPPASSSHLVLLAVATTTSQMGSQSLSTASGWASPGGFVSNGEDVLAELVAVELLHDAVVRLALLGDGVSHGGRRFFARRGLRLLAHGGGSSSSPPWRPSSSRLGSFTAPGDDVEAGDAGGGGLRERRGSAGQAMASWVSAREDRSKSASPRAADARAGSRGRAGKRECAWRGTHRARGGRSR